MKLFYHSSCSSTPNFKHFTVEDAEELRDRKIE